MARVAQRHGPTLISNLYQSTADPKAEGTTAAPELLGKCFASHFADLHAKKKIIP